MVKKIWRAILKFFGWYKEKEEINPFIPQLSFPWSTEEHELSDLVNIYRLEMGKSDVLPEKLHCEIARKRNIENFDRETISHAGFFKTAEELIKTGMTVGEALGYKYYNVYSALNAFKASESHNRLLLGDWDYIGVGVNKKDGDNYYCLIFSRRNK